jgi:hypothetical protein
MKLFGELKNYFSHGKGSGVPMDEIDYSDKEEWSFDVKFFGLDLDKQELVPLKEFVKILKSRKTKEG